MRTESQKAFLWKAVDRKRDTFFARGEKIFLEALTKQIAPVIVAVEQGGDPEAALSPKAIQSAMVELYVLVGVAFAREQYQSLKGHEPDYQTKADAEESVWVRFMRRFALEKAVERIETMTATTKKKVRSVLEIAAKEGLSIPNTVKLMVDEFQGINKTRATVLARTEILSSSNMGSYLGARSTGLALNKEWLSTRDVRTRRPKKGNKFNHVEADGQEVDLEAMFIVSGEKLAFPGDYENGASAGNLVQCRCSILYNPK